MKDYEDDRPWMWVAFAPGCRLIIAFVIGPRKQYVADELLELTAKCLSESRPLFVSDGLKFYTKALLKKFGEIEEFPRTGKKGRPKNPKLVPSDNLRYVQVIKKRKGGRLQKIAKKIIFGKDIEEREISTSLLERQNPWFPNFKRIISTSRYSLSIRAHLRMNLSNL